MVTNQASPLRRPDSPPGNVKLEVSFCSLRTTEPHMAPTSRTHQPPVAHLDLSAPVVEAMRTDLPRVAEQVVRAVQAEVPSYADPFRGRMGRNIENAVQLALGG